MGYYETDADVEAYVVMAEGYDGAEVLQAFAGRLQAGARVLELGMGAGKDLELLAQAGYVPTGSDASEAFLRRYESMGEGARHETLRLDAVTIETERRFDAVYSNKVLHHLTREQFAASLRRQAQVVTEGGYLLHALWHGNDEDTFKGMLVVSHDESTLRDATPPELELVAHERYAEMEAGDSIWALWRRRVD